MSYSLQIAAVLFGVMLIGIFNFSNQRNTKFLLAFSGAYLFSIVVLHFLPEIFHHHQPNIGIFILGGFLLQILLDFYSTGIEHGHYHQHDFKQGVLPIGAILGLFVHAFFEGLPIELQHNHSNQKAILAAIVLHKVPITIVLYTLLNSLLISNKKLWLIIVLFALMSPLGTLLGASIPGIENWGIYLTAFATGIFLHVSTTILFESGHNHRYNFAKLFVVFLGMALAYVSNVVF